MTSNPNSRLRHPSIRLLPLLLIALAALVLPYVAHAQATTPTVSSVAITSSPGMDNTYATGDTITVSLTFSEAVTVTGTPHVVVDIGGQPRNFKYSGDGSTAAAQPFSYTVLVGDKDADGVSFAGQQPHAEQRHDPGHRRLHQRHAHPCRHDVRQPQGGHRGHPGEQLRADGPHRDTITVSATESATVSMEVPYTFNGFDLTAVALDIKTASTTLDVTVTAVAVSAVDPYEVSLFPTGYAFTFSGSAATTGRQTFVLANPARANVNAGLPGPRLDQSFFRIEPLAEPAPGRSR